MLYYFSFKDLEIYFSMQRFYYVCKNEYPRDFVVFLVYKLIVFINVHGHFQCSILVSSEIYFPLSWLSPVFVSVSCPL